MGDAHGQFVTAYYRFVNQSYLVPENIIFLSMDGPSVNKLFKEKFESDLEKKGHFIMLDHVPYIQYLTVSQKVCETLMKLIWISLLSICTVFSSSHLKKSKNILMWKSSQKFMVSACWDTFLLDGSVLVRIMKQFTKLREYFLKFLATQKGFNDKRRKAASERYIRFKNATECHVFYSNLSVFFWKILFFIKFLDCFFEYFFLFFKCTPVGTLWLSGWWSKCIFS